MDSTHYFSKQFDIQSHLVDKNFNVNLQPLMGCMQTVADEHVDSLHLGWHDLHSQNYFWVLYRFGFQINRLPKKYERITITTWANSPMNVIQPRNFEIKDAQGEVIIKSYTLWTILDSLHFATHHINEVNGGNVDYYVDEKSFEFNLKIPKIILPNNFSTIGRDVLFSDIDYNQHVNNTAYIRWLIDHYPVEFIDAHNLVEVVINYTQQARLGEQYSIYTERQSELEHLSLIYNAQSKKEICKIKTHWSQKF